MPPDDPNEAAWICSDQIPKLPRQNLPREEVEAFLNAMFASLAVKPKPVKLKEGASVVRYLKATAWSSKPGEERLALERLADAVAQMVLKAAPIRMASQREAIEFIERHAGTYLFHPKLEATLKFLRKSRGPHPGLDFFPQPKLASRGRAVFGSGQPRTADDLSERIYAAYHALRRANCHRARRLVAQALNRHERGSAAQNSAGAAWGADEVAERVKQYEARLKRDLQIAGPESLQLVRDTLADSWISSVQSQMAAVRPIRPCSAANDGGRSTKRPVQS